MPFTSQSDLETVRRDKVYEGVAKQLERLILKNHAAGFNAARLERAELARVASAEELCQMRESLGEVRVDDGIIEYIADIVGRSRAHRSVYLGASPRASIGLLAVARALAASEGRDYVIPDDVKALCPAVLRHRLILHPDAEIEGISADDCIEEILRDVRVPATIAA